VILKIDGVQEVIVLTKLGYLSLYLS